MAAVLLASPLVTAAQVVTGAGGATATSLNVQTLSTGTVLNVTPAASPDHRYIGMSINPQFSTVEGIDTFVLSNTATTVGSVVGTPGVPLAVAMRREPFRPAQAGHVTFVDTDKPLLATRMAAIDWKATSIKDAFRKLADISRLNIVLGNRGLQRAGIDLDSPRDFSAPAGTMRETILALLRTAAPETDLVITAEDKVIQVDTQAQADLVMITRTYYLEDLLANLPRIVAGGTNLNNIGTGNAAGTAAPARVAPLVDVSKPLDLSKPPAPRAAPAPATRPRPSNSTNILEVITDTVRPEIWKNHGGQADIALVNNRVTIKAPASVHALLDGPKVYNPNKVPSYIQYSQ